MSNTQEYNIHKHRLCSVVNLGSEKCSDDDDYDHDDDALSFKLMLVNRFVFFFTMCINEK